MRCVLVLIILLDYVCEKDIALAHHNDFIATMKLVRGLFTANTNARVEDAFCLRLPICCDHEEAKEYKRRRVNELLSSLDALHVHEKVCSFLLDFKSDPH